MDGFTSVCPRDDCDYPVVSHTIIRHTPGQEYTGPPMARFHGGTMPARRITVRCFGGHATDVREHEYSTAHGHRFRA